MDKLMIELRQYPGKVVVKMPLFEWEKDSNLLKRKTVCFSSNVKKEFCK